MGDAFLRQRGTGDQALSSDTPPTRAVDLVHMRGDPRGLEKIPDSWHSGARIAMRVDLARIHERENQTNPTAAESLAFMEIGPEKEPSKPERSEGVRP
jgi:hypothetical protein